MIFLRIKIHCGRRRPFSRPSLNIFPLCLEKARMNRFFLVRLVWRRKSRSMKRRNQCRSTSPMPRRWKTSGSSTLPFLIKWSRIIYEKPCSAGEGKIEFVQSTTLWCDALLAGCSGWSTGSAVLKRGRDSQSMHSTISLLSFIWGLPSSSVYHTYDTNVSQFMDFLVFYELPAYVSFERNPLNLKDL